MHRLTDLAARGYCPALLYDDEWNRWYLHLGGTRPRGDKLLPDPRWSVVVYPVPDDMAEWHATPEAAIEAALMAIDLEQADDERAGP